MKSRLEILLSKYIFNSWSSAIALFAPTACLIIAYLIFERFIEEKINCYWIDAYLSGISKSSLWGICLLVLVLQGIYVVNQSRTKNFVVRPIEVFILFFYLKYRFCDDLWIYYPYEWSVNLFDTIPIVILSSKLIAAASFYFTLNNSDEKIGIIDPDLPLNDSNPVDELNRTKFATELVMALKSIRPSRRSLVIGINGSWGSGKTSLQYLISQTLKDRENTESFYEISFNPWLYSREKSLAQAFLNVVKQAIVKKQYIISHTIDRYAETLLHSTEGILTKTRFLKDFKNEQSVEIELANVKSQIADLNKTLLIIIDDLDRLSGVELMEVFRLVRLVGDFPNTIYIILYDKEYVQQVIADKMIEKNSASYIDKIVQVEYSISEINIDKIRQLFLSHLSKALRYGIPESERFWDDQQINSLIQEEIFNDCIKNIRDVKRFTNNFLLRYKSIFTDVNFSQFFLIELIRHKFPDYMLILFSNRNTFNIAVNDSPAFRLPDVPVTGKFWQLLLNERNLHQALIRMAEFRNENNSISVPFNFPHYFTLTLHEDFIHDSEFNNILKNSVQSGEQKLQYWIGTNADMLVYRFRNYASFNEIDDFARYLQHLAFVSVHIQTIQQSELAKILVDKYELLYRNKTFDVKELYKKASLYIYDEHGYVNNTLRDTFRGRTNYLVEGNYTDSPLKHGWKSHKDVSDLIGAFSPEISPIKGRYMIFNAPFKYVLHFDFSYPPAYLRNVRCEFQLFDSIPGFFHIKLQVRKGDDTKIIFFRPSEQPNTDGIGKISEIEYVIGEAVTIWDGWRTFEVDIDHAFRLSDFAFDGYELGAIVGISIKGAVGFGKFELY